MSVNVEERIAHLRELSALLRSSGWSVREGAQHSLGELDIAARTAWRRGENEAVLRLLIVIDEEPGQLAFSALDGKVAHAPHTFTLGDLSPRVDAPPAHIRASYVRSSAGDASIRRALAALDGVYADLARFAQEFIAGDGNENESTIASFTRRCELLHAVVVTSQTMRAEAIRFEQSDVVSAGGRWIDIVQAPAFPKFAAALTRHYASRYKRRKFIETA